MHKRMLLTLATLMLALSVLMDQGYSQENMLSISKHSSHVRQPLSQARDTYRINFATDVCIRGAWLREVGPSGNIMTLVSLDPRPPFEAEGMEGRSGDLFFALAHGPGHSDVNKEAFFPAGTCRFVPTGIDVFIYTLDDVDTRGGAFDHVTTINYTEIAASKRALP